MQTGAYAAIQVEQKILVSQFLERAVTIDFYVPRVVGDPSALSLLLVNDGQNLPEMHFAPLLNDLLETHQVRPLLVAGIHAGDNRLAEYGTAGVLDYSGRGARAAAYHRFVLEELLPFIHITYCVEQFVEKAFAGFSLGGLSALDVVWRHPGQFSRAGVFSGSFWWRSKSLDEDYNEDTDRIMHALIRQRAYVPGQQFFFTTGSLDETADRNNNGIIDSIDDTLALIAELEAKGYDTEIDIRYLNFEDGHHDPATWAKALPLFLLWGEKFKV